MRRRSGPKIAQLAAVLRLDPPPLPVAWIAPEDHARAAALLPADRPIVALAPTANWAPKVWPAERFAALFAALRDGALPGAIAAIFAGSGEEERAMAAPLLDALPDAIDLTGRLNLAEAAACLARAQLFVGNDSGLMHLAAAAGAPTLGLFGPTDAAEYAPSGRRAAATIAATGQMQDLSVAQALQAAAALLES
jgi:ADP-heptose:LPS heptosyltransferase